jgi:hypothetical protein
MNPNRRRAFWRKSVALLALVSTLSGAWLTVVHGSLADDSACAAESGLPITPHRSTIGSGSGGIAPQHCYICHWLRSLHSVSGGDVPMLAAGAPAGFVCPDPITPEGHLALVLLPARSPPA